MDLANLAQQLRIDAALLDVHGALRQAEVPHLFLKGPTTAFWLYDPPRSYVDVDVLVPPHESRRAVIVLTEAGIASPEAGRAGEEASHAHVLRTSSLVEVDLHLSLPLRRPADAPEDWLVLEPEIVPFDLSGTAVPGLSERARGLVLCLHALGGGLQNEKAQEDLRRARSLGTAYWRTVEELAEGAGLAAHVEAAVALQDGRSLPTDLPLDVRLLAAGATPAAVQLSRLDLRSKHGRRLLVRELFPSPGFMRSTDVRATTWWTLPRSYLARWVHIGRTLPAAITELRRQRSRQKP